MGYRCRITVDVEVLLIFLFDMDSCVRLPVSPSGVFAWYCWVEFPWRLYQYLRLVFLT